MPDSDSDSVIEIENKQSSEQAKSDFESSYRNFKMKEELQRELSKIDDFYYKLELLSYTLVIIFSIFLILQGFIDFIDGLRFYPFINIVFIFGYTAFFGFYLLRRKKRKFRRNLIERIERQYQFEESKKQ